MLDRNKRLRARFYETPAGREPVREWLRAMPSEDRKIIGKNVAKVEFGWPIGMPYCRPLGDGLREVRSEISDGRIARILFIIKGSEMILLHGFIKKSRQTPKNEIDLANRRLKELS